MSDLIIGIAGTLAACAGVALGLWLGGLIDTISWRLGRSAHRRCFTGTSRKKREEW